MVVLLVCLLLILVKVSVLRLLIVVRGYCLAHHVCRILEHLVRHIELTFLIDVVRLGSLPDINIPQTKHLVTLNFNLCLSITGCDSSPILLDLPLVCRDAATILYLVRSIIFHLCTVEVLGMCRRFA